MRNVISLAAAIISLAALSGGEAQAAFTSPGGVIGAGWANVPAQTSLTVIGDPSAARVVPVGTTLSWQVKNVISLPAELAVDASPVPQNPMACQMTIATQPQKLRRDAAGLWWLNQGPGATVRGYTTADGAAPAMTWDSTSGVEYAFRGYQQSRIDVSFSEPGFYAVTLYLSSDFCPPAAGSGNSGSGNVVAPGGGRLVAKYLVEARSAAEWQRPETGWYWDPTQPGRGFAMQINEAQDAGFIGVFGYDDAGKATFLVSTCRYDPATRVCLGNLDGFEGGPTINQLTGPSATGTGTVSTVSVQWNPINSGGIGKGNRGAVITYKGISRRLERFATPGSGETAADPKDLSKGAGVATGWYWHPNAAGRGYFVETTRLTDGSGRIATYIVGFMYRSDRSATWYVMMGTSAQTAAPYTMDGQAVLEFGGGSPITTSGTNNIWATAAITAQPGLYNMALPGGTNPVMYLPGLTGQTLVPFTISPP